MMKTRKWLIQSNACVEGLEWAGNKSIKEIWDTCHNFRWILLNLDESMYDRIMLIEKDYTIALGPMNELFDIEPVRADELFKILKSKFADSLRETLPFEQLIPFLEKAGIEY